MRKHFFMATVVVIAMAACSQSADKAEHSDTQAIHYTDRVLSRGGQNVVAVGPEYHADLVGLLPNARYHYPSGPVQTGSDAVVLARVVGVVGNHGFVVDADHPDGRMVDFDNPKALWRTFWVDARVERVVGVAQDVSPVGQRVRFELSIDRGDDFALVRQGLMARPATIYFLRGEEGDAEGGVTYRVLRSGGLVVGVDDNGRLSLPLLGREGSDADHLLARADTLEELETAASRPVHDLKAQDPYYTGK